MAIWLMHKLLRSNSVKGDGLCLVLNFALLIRFRSIPIKQTNLIELKILVLNILTQLHASVD